MHHSEKSIFLHNKMIKKFKPKKVSKKTHWHTPHPVRGKNYRGGREHWGRRAGVDGWNVTWQGRGTTSQGHSLGRMHPLNIHACSLITCVVQILQGPLRAEVMLSGNTREDTSGAGLRCSKRCNRLDTSVTCAHTCTYTNILPQSRPARSWPSQLMC